MKNRFTLLIIFFSVFRVQVYGGNGSIRSFVEENLQGTNVEIDSMQPLSSGTQIKSATYYRDGQRGHVFFQDNPSEINSVLFFSDNSSEESSIPPQLIKIFKRIEDSRLFDAVDRNNRSGKFILEKRSQFSDSITPLIKTKWSQSWPYNSYCPEYKNSEPKYRNHTAAGCLAVAMAQLLNYYKYPHQGTGAHSYTDSTGTHKADFGNTQYMWEKMPDSLNDSSREDEIEAVATLISQCGISVETQYNAMSGADFDNAKKALESYFGYSPSTFLRDHFPFETMEAFHDSLKNEIRCGRPVLFSADGTIGHGFILDGYKYIEGTLFFHVNWGWGGDYNGYFNVNYLTVGSYSLNEYHRGYIHCAPAVLFPPRNLRLLTDIWPPILDWDPVPHAAGYAFDLQLNITQSVGSILAGPDSTGLDVRLLYNMSEKDTFKIKVCSIDSTGLYSKWAYINIVKNNGYKTVVPESVIKQRSSFCTFTIGVRKYSISLPLMEGTTDLMISLISPQGRVVAKRNILQNHSCNLTNNRTDVAAGPYFLQVLHNGKRICVEPVFVFK